MSTTLPPALKSLQMYLKTAERIQNKSPVLAYHCRFFAVSEGMKKYRKVAGASDWFGAMLGKLESDKNQLKADPESQAKLADLQACYTEMEQMAYKFFNTADKQDRAGKASSKTVQLFYTAAALFDCLAACQPPELEPDQQVDEIKQYAKWKTVYIAQCLKSGEPIIPGPKEEEGANVDMGDDDNNNNKNNNNNSNNNNNNNNNNNGLPTMDGLSDWDGQPSLQLPPPSPPPTTASYNPPPVTSSYQPPPTTTQPVHPYPTLSTPTPTPTHAPAPAPAPSYSQSPQLSRTSSSMSFTPNLNVSIANQDEAAKCAKYAQSSIDMDDIPGAVDYLMKALKLITK